MSLRHGHPHPDQKTLQRNVKKVEAATLERIHVHLVEHAITAKIDDGDKLRVDCTGVKNSLTTPDDSQVLDGSDRTGMCGTTLGGERLLCWRGGDYELACDLRFCWFSSCVRSSQPSARARVSSIDFIILIWAFMAIKRLTSQFRDRAPRKRAPRHD